MPAPSPRISNTLQKQLRQLGQQLRTQRKRLGITVAATAEAAGISRETLHRIERGQASVTIGAYLTVISAIGLELELLELNDTRARGRGSRKTALELPGKIRLADYPQLKKLAWQLKGTKEINPEEALEIYERNWRHVDLKKMDRREQGFLKRLLQAFGRERLLV